LTHRVSHSRPALLFTVVSFHSPLSYFFTIRRHPRSTLFPYTTLFRSSRTSNSPGGTVLVVVSRSREAAGPAPERTTRVSSILTRSEEHTSELQSPDHLVCRLLLEKKKIRTSKRPAECIRHHRRAPKPK